MRINNNLMAMNTHRQLSITNGAAAKSIEKLSSGFRINRAGDDAAGLAISEKMRGQIRGLTMASKNAQDGISLIQTAEGALSETHAILQRMRELAVQSANDTNNDADRGQIQKEIEQLKSEIDRISSTTEFNTKKLIDGSVGQTASITSNNANVIDVRAVDPKLTGQTTIAFANVTKTTNNFIAAAGVTQANVTIATPAGGNGIKAGFYTLELQGAANNASITLKDAQGNVVASATGADTTANYDLQAGGNTLLTLAGGAYNGNGGTVSFDVVIQGDLTFTRSDGSVKTYTGLKANAASVMVADGFEIDVTTRLTTAENAVVNVTNNGVKFQIGANEKQTTQLAINKMDTTSLKVADINVSTQSGASQAVTIINDAIEKVSTERSKLGAIQNRLEHTIKNLDTSAENLQAAESRIRDVDMAKEMMEFTKQNILMQAAQAMLAQANQAPQGVLQLLR